MGVQQLWPLLEEARDAHGRCIPIQSWCAGAGQHVDIANEVHGKTVAVDLSIWMLQVR